MNPILLHVLESHLALERMWHDEACLAAVESFAISLVETFAQGGRVLACGNGGSAADAQHFVAELVGRYRTGSRRRPLPALSLSSDSSVVTALANDFGYDGVFARQVRALGGPRDLLLAISTSGSSRNVLEACLAARDLGMVTVGLTGAGEPPLCRAAHLCVGVPAREAAIIQQLHGVILHAVCARLDGERSLAQDH